jgi:hypothetical protein
MSESAKEERHVTAGFGSDPASSAQDRLIHLRELVGRLGDMVTTYEANPGTTYSNLKPTEEIIGEIHVEMRFLFDNGGSLSGETDWAAFGREEQQYIGMYTAAWKTMGAYKAAEAYNPLRDPNVRPPPPKPAEIPRLIENEKQLEGLLWDHLHALRYLHGKVAAMLSN